MFRLQEGLGELSGFDSVSLQPAAGAQGELAGVLMIKKYHASRGGYGANPLPYPRFGSWNESRFCGHGRIHSPGTAVG
jgi:hypothetical protein